MMDEKYFEGAKAVPLSLPPRVPLGGSGQGPVQQTIMLDGRVLAKSMSDHLPSVLRFGGARMIFGGTALADVPLGSVLQDPGTITDPTSFQAITTELNGVSNGLSSRLAMRTWRKKYCAGGRPRCVK